MRDLKLVFKDKGYSFQSLRALALTATGGGDIGECLTCIYRIAEGNDEGWYASWRAMGEQVAFQAEKFFSCGDHSGARECWFRASQYYRSAEFFLHGNLADPRINDIWRLSRNCFIEGMHLSDGLIQPVQIPYEKTSLPGYFCRIDHNGRQRPLIIIHTGLDGTAEELYFSNAVLALKRGFNVLIFEGPGQGQVIHEQKLNFRSDWENVITPVVDYALQQKEVDPQRIALLGISFGGYLAARAAAFEHRLAALILDGGIYNYHAICMGPLWPRAEKWLDNPFICCTLDRIIPLLMKIDPGIRWGLNEGLYKFGAINPSEWFRITRFYTMQEIAGLISCPTLVVDSEADKLCPEQSRRMYDALTCPKEFMLFTSAWGAQEHCQIGATFIANEQIYNWLMRTFNMLPAVNHS
ncbi:MAG: alpha/beta fold hydrolase [Dehalococcoidia bacterium]